MPHKSNIWEKTFGLFPDINIYHTVLKVYQVTYSQGTQNISQTRVILAYMEKWMGQREWRIFVTNERFANHFHE